MTTIAFTLLFVSAGVFALAVIVVSLHRHGPRAMRLHQELRPSRQGRQLHYAETEIRLPLQQAAQTLRPGLSSQYLRRQMVGQLSAAA